MAKENLEFEHMSIFTVHLRMKWYLKVRVGASSYCRTT